MNKNDEKNTQNSGVDIDIKRVFKAVFAKTWLILTSAILCAALSLLATVHLITPKYQSSALFYVNNGAFSLGDASFSLTSGDISAAKSLVDTYIVILNSRECLNQVIDYSGVDRSYSELKKMISASSVNETEVFQVVVTSPDPQEAEKIATAIAHHLPKRIASIVEGTSANIVDTPILPAEPSSPSRMQNTLLGFFVGALVCTIALAIREIFDTTIQTEENIEQCCSLPILASVPDMSAPIKGGYYGYGKPRKMASVPAGKNPPEKKSEPIVGKKISFSAFEAYKLLRTKLQFSFVDDIACPVIGISSAMTGEGKSLSAVNLAYSLSQLEKRILLIDCDMRRPSLNLKLPVQKSPGLSEYLTGHAPMDNVTQFCKVDDEGSFAVISSGRNPPNPIELLSSAKMENALQQLRQHFDYIILDLPPVGEVSDALVASKLVDGILLVVRQNYCNTVALTGAVGQFEFINARILGIVLNCVGEHTGKYYRYNKKYGKYSRRYGYSRYSKYRYASHYESAAEESRKTKRAPTAPAPQASKQEKDR